MVLWNPYLTTIICNFVYSQVSVWLFFRILLLIIGNDHYWDVNPLVINWRSWWPWSLRTSLAFLYEVSSDVAKLLLLASQFNPRQLFPQPDEGSLAAFLFLIFITHIFYVMKYTFINAYSKQAPQFTMLTLNPGVSRDFFMQIPIGSLPSTFSQTKSFILQKIGQLKIAIFVCLEVFSICPQMNSFCGYFYQF